METQTEDDLTRPRKEKRKLPNGDLQSIKNEQIVSKENATCKEDTSKSKQSGTNSNFKISTEAKVPVMQYQCKDSTKNARISKKTPRKTKLVEKSEKSTNMERTRTVSEDESLDISSALFELGRDLKVPIPNNTIIIQQVSTTESREVSSKKAKLIEFEKVQSKEIPIKDKETPNDISETPAMSLSTEQINSENSPNLVLAVSETSECNVEPDVLPENKNDEVNKENQIIESSPQNTIRTIDAINRQAIKILDRLPPTMVTESVTKSSSVQTTAEISTSQKTETPSNMAQLTATNSSDSTMVSQVESCLKLLSDGKFSGFLHSADCKANCGSGQTSCVSSSIQNVCEQIFNAPMSANIASMFAKRRNKTQGTGNIECPELMRVRIAESLLLLGELSKSQCKSMKKFDPCSYQ